MKINFGCGYFRKPGYVNVDWQADVAPDIVHDLNALPYPFPDNSVHLIEAFHVLEHLDRPFAVMREFHRILAPGGELHIKVPHFSRGFTHAEHAHGFDITFPLYFQRGLPISGAVNAHFTLRRQTIRWIAFFHLLPMMGYKRPVINVLRGLSWVISGAANLAPGIASRLWCYWVGGFDEIEFVFAADK